MRLTRKPDRGVDDRAALDAFLDEQLSGVLATVHEGRPHVIPIAYARDGDRLLFHGSTGAGCGTARPRRCRARTLRRSTGSRSARRPGAAAPRRGRRRR